MENFKERQKFKQWWLWAILAGAVLIPVGMVWYEMFVLRKHYDTPALISGACLPLSILVLFYFFRLDTMVDRRGVYYKFFPFQFSYKVVEWSELSKAYVRKYSPMGEYGGWGIRFGLGGKGMSYSVAGNMGLQLIRKNGKKTLIGTQQAPEMQKFLETLAKERCIDWSAIQP